MPRKKKTKKVFTIKSPAGMLYRTECIATWCKENEDKLPPVHRRSQPVWELAAASLINTFQWRGYKLVEVE